MNSNVYILQPAFIMVLGSILLPLVSKKFRSIGFLIFPALSLVSVILLPQGIFGISNELFLCNVDKLSRIFGAIFAFIVLAGAVYAYHITDIVEMSMALLYGGSALGVTFAGDFFTLFIFWELMAVSSTYLVLAGNFRDSSKAGLRYFFVHLFGGSCLLAGILMHLSETGNYQISGILNANSVSSWLMLAGVALNAAIPPLSAWLSDAYPKASITGAVFLSALTTKAAVYVLIRCFAGWEILFYAGVIMTLYGVVYAILENDIRGVLAYHIISQVGFMVAGVGIGTELSLNGSTAHAFSHILYKALLFMAAGAVIYSTGSNKLTNLGGLISSLKTVFILYMVGAFSISGVPLFNGFISKSIIIHAAGVAHKEIGMLLLDLASIGTFLSLGLKLPFFIWFSNESSVNKKMIPVNMLIGMGLLSALCLMFGIMPSLLYRYLPFNAEYHPYTMSHITETLQLLVFAFVGFWLFRTKLAGESKISLDTDWFYRKPKRYVRKICVDSINYLFTIAEEIVLRIAIQMSAFARNPYAFVRGESVKKTGAKIVENFNPDKERQEVAYILGSVLLVFLAFLFIWLLIN